MADPCHLNALTPNHFLLGEFSTSIPSVVGNSEFDHLKRYARAQSYGNAIWSRCIREYVPTMNPRSMWQTPAGQHLKTGDLVWIVEETNPRGSLPYRSDCGTPLRLRERRALRCFTYVDRFTRLPACKTCTSFPNIFFRAGGCYEVNK